MSESGSTTQEFIDKHGVEYLADLLDIKGYNAKDTRKRVTAECERSWKADGMQEDANGVWVMLHLDNIPLLPVRVSLQSIFQTQGAGESLTPEQDAYARKIGLASVCYPS